MQVLFDLSERFQAQLQMRVMQILGRWGGNADGLASPHGELRRRTHCRRLAGRQHPDVLISLHAEAAEDNDGASECDDLLLYGRRGLLEADPTVAVEGEQGVRGGLHGVEEADG